MSMLVFTRVTTFRNCLHMKNYNFYLAHSSAIQLSNLLDLSLLLVVSKTVSMIDGRNRHKPN